MPISSDKGFATVWSGRDLLIDGGKWSGNTSQHVRTRKGDTTAKKNYSGPPIKISSRMARWLIGGAKGNGGHTHRYELAPKSNAQWNVDAAHAFELTPFNPEDGHKNLFKLHNAAVDFGRPSPVTDHVCELRRLCSKKETLAEGFDRACWLVRTKKLALDDAVSLFGEWPVYQKHLRELFAACATAAERHALRDRADWMFEENRYTRQPRPHFDTATLEEAIKKTQAIARAAQNTSAASTFIDLLEALKLPLSMEWLNALTEVVRAGGEGKRAEIRIETVLRVHRCYDRHHEQYIKYGHCLVEDFIYNDNPEPQRGWWDACEEARVIDGKYQPGEFHSRLDLRRSKSKDKNTAKWTTEIDSLRRPLTLDEQVEMLRRKWRGHGPDTDDAPSGVREPANYNAKLNRETVSPLMSLELTKAAITPSQREETAYVENKPVSFRPKSPKLRTLKRTGQPIAKDLPRYPATKAEWASVRRLDCEEQHKQFVLRRDAAAKTESVLVGCLRQQQKIPRCQYCSHIHPVVFGYHGSSAFQPRDRDAKPAPLTYDESWDGLRDRISEPTPLELRWSIVRWKQYLVEIGGDYATASDPPVKWRSQLAEGSADTIDVLAPETALVRIRHNPRFDNKGKWLPTKERGFPAIVPRGLCKMNENGEHTLDWRIVALFTANGEASIILAKWYASRVSVDEASLFKNPPHRVPKYGEPGKKHRDRRQTYVNNLSRSVDELRAILANPEVLKDPRVIARRVALEQRQAIQSKPMPRRKRKWTGQKWGECWRLLTANSRWFFRRGVCECGKWQAGKWWCGESKLPLWFDPGVFSRSVAKTLWDLNEQIAQRVLGWEPAKRAAFVNSRPIWSQIFLPGIEAATDEYTWVKEQWGAEILTDDDDPEGRLGKGKTWRGSVGWKAPLRDIDESDLRLLCKATAANSDRHLMRIWRALTQIAADIGLVLGQPEIRLPEVSAVCLYRAAREAVTVFEASRPVPYQSPGTLTWWTKQRPGPLDIRVMEPLTVWPHDVSLYFKHPMFTWEASVFVLEALERTVRFWD